jgi:Fur family peroxide stress response transcriptional regulator
MKTKRTARELTAWCAAFEASCRERGVRVTTQRLAVYRALAADGSHPTAEEVHARLGKVLPGLALTSVYRILDSLGGERLIRRVSTTDGVARFDAKLAQHEHLVCRVCGTMTDYASPELRALLPARVAVPGFDVEDLDLRLVGRCASCRDASARKLRNRKQKRGRGRAAA